MKNQYYITTKAFKLLVLFVFIHSLSPLFAQTPSDAIMMVPRQICAGAFYSHSFFDHYWEGDYLRTNGTIETVHRFEVAGGAAIGVLPHVNLLLNFPYVWTHSSEPNGGKFQGANGFQDFTVAIKGEVLRKQIGHGKLAFLATAAFSSRMSNYLSDYRPYSLGNGTDEFDLRGILQYKFDSGLYVRGAVAHMWRGSTKAERDYYYNNGSYYSAWMDVPNAWSYEAVAGWWLFDESLKLEVNYVGQSSTSGDDIRPYNAAQPTNKVDFGRLGFATEYYLSKPTGLAIHAAIAETLTGRNTGKATMINIGLSYFFFVGKPDPNSPIN